MLSELERLMKEATEGPWTIKPCSIKGASLLLRPYKMQESIQLPTEDAALIVALRNNAEALIAVARAAEKVCQETHPTHRTLAVAKLRAAIQKVKEGV